MKFIRVRVYLDDKQEIMNLDIAYGGHLRWGNVENTKISSIEVYEEETDD